MRSCWRIAATVILAGLAVVTLLVAGQSWADPVQTAYHTPLMANRTQLEAIYGPTQTAQLMTSPDRLAAHLAVSDTIEPRIYLPLVAHGVSSSTYALPSNLSSVERFYPLTDTARTCLRRQGFVILNTAKEESLSYAYEVIASDQALSVFVTSDAMLYLFHAVLDDLLMTVEKEALYTETLTLVRELQADSLAIYATMPVTQTLGQEAARHNLVVFSVARALLEPEFAPPSQVLTDVISYTHKITEHTTVERYPGDDYTQYKPRGHYAGDPQLERYVRAVKWLGRRIYRIQDNVYPHDADVEIVASVLVAQMLQENPGAQAAWQPVYDVTRRLVGPADSITPPLVSMAVSRTFGTSFTLALLEQPENLALLRDELMTNDDYPTSEIIPVPALPGQIPPRYVQVMGERYLPDSEVMQKTVYTYTSHLLPSGLDVMAALLESDQADALLADQKAQDPAFAAQLAALRAQFGGYTATWWTRSTYNSWLYSLEPLLVPYDEAYPRFMQSAAWERKELNTSLASWAHLRHDFILYGKQPYATLGGGSGYGFVEPVPEFYTRLGDACRQISTTLAVHGVLPEPHGWALGELAARLDTFAGYAAKIAAGGSLSDTEQSDVHTFGRWLGGFFGEHSVGEKTPVTVADVASDPNTTQVLHEGVGLFNPIVIIYEEPDGTPLAGLGYVMSYYEFALPGWERLTDAQWQTRVISGTPPARPWWVVDLLDT
jgi:hypothetical protein